MILSEAIDKVNMLTEDCTDLKRAICVLEDLNTQEELASFIIANTEFKRVSTSLLVSSLVLLEEDLRTLLSSEIVIKEVPGE